MKRMLLIVAGLTLAAPGLCAAQPRQDSGRIFVMLDANGDGRLDKAEVTRMAEMRAERQGDPSLASPERVNAVFGHLDANGDGFIDRAELETMRKARAPAPPPEDQEGVTPPAN